MLYLSSNPALTMPAHSQAVLPIAFFHGSGKLLADYKFRNQY